LASKCEQLDGDGLTLYTYSSEFKRIDGATQAKLEEVLSTITPSGTPSLANVLTHAINSYFERKNDGQTKDGETFMIVSNSAPPDSSAVIESVVEATQRLSSELEMAIAFIQVGNDSEAAKFFSMLDEQLLDMGAKFDICDKVTIDSIDKMSLTEVLLNAIAD